MALETTVVGRVAVRVIPDTDDFRSDLKRKLEAETAGIDAEVPVDATLDSRQMEEELRAKVKELTDRFEVRLKTALQDIRRKVAATTKAAEAQSKANPITFETELDSDIARGVRRGMREAISLSTASAISQMFNRGMKLDRSGLALLREEMEAQFTKDPMKVRVTLDKPSLSRLRDQFGDTLTESYRRSLTSKEQDKYRRRFSVDSGSGTSIDLKPNVVKRQAERIKNTFFNLRTELARLGRDLKWAVKADVDEPSLTRAQVALELWFQRLKIAQVKIKAVLDKKSVAAVGTTLAALSGGRLFKKVASLEPFKNLDTDLPKIAAMMTMFGQIANYLISMSSDALGLARSIGYIAPAAFALPGIFMATASAMYAIILPLREFNKRIPLMGQGLKAMQSSMTDAFWQRASSGMSQLTKLLPALNKGFTSLGTAAGTFMGSLSSNVVKNLGPELAPFFASIEEAFGSITKASAPISRILANFVKLGTVYMPRLGKATEVVIGRFDRWISQAMSSGDMFAWIERGIVNLKALGKVAAGAYRIFDGLSQAAEAAGGANLTTFAAALDTIQRTIKKADFQARLVNVFRSARVAIEQMVEVSGPAVTKMFTQIGDNANKLLPRIGEAAGRLVSILATIVGSDVVGASLINFFNSLNSALRSLEPSMKNVSKGLAGVINVMATMLTSFAPIVEIAFGALESHADGLMKTVQDVVRNLSAGFTGLLRELMPVVDKLAPALLDIATAISSTLGSLAPAIGKFAAPLLGAIANIVTAFSKLPGILQLAVVAFAIFKVKALGGLGAAIAIGIFKLKGLGAAFTSMTGPIGTASAKVQNFSTRAKAGLGSLGGAAGKLGLVGLAIGAVGSALSSSKIAPGIEQITLALEKLSKSDLSGLDAIADKVGMDYRGTPLLNGLNGLGAAVQNIKGEGWAKSVNEFADSLWEFVGLGGVFKSGGGKAREYFKIVEQGLLALQSTDPAKASVAFDQIATRAKALGLSVDELKQLMPEYAAAVELAAGQASGTFGKSAEEVKASAQEVQSTIEGMFSKMETRINALRGKSRTSAIAEITKARGDMLKGLAETTTGLDAKMVEQATRLNGRIAEVVARLNRTKDEGARKGLKEKLDGLLAEYKERFSSLPELISQATSGANPQATLDAIFSGHSVNASAGASLSVQIQKVYAQAKTAAATGATELRTVMQTGVGNLNLAGNVTSGLAPAIARAFEMAKTAAQIGAAQLKVTISTATEGIRINGFLGSGLTTSIAVAFGGARDAVRVNAASLKAVVTSSTRSAFSGAGAAANGYLKAIRSKMNEVPNIVSGVSGRVRKAAVFSLYPAGKSVGTSYVSGLRSTIPDIIAAARAMSKATKDNKGPIAYDRIMLIPEGVATGMGYVKGLLSTLPAVKAAAREITDAVVGSDFDHAINRAAKSAGQVKTLSNISVGTSQYVTQIGDVTVDVSQLEGIKTVDDLAKTLRRKKRQAGGKK